jgi:5-methylcytosine-specific restriction endonuclease McrA
MSSLKKNGSTTQWRKIRAMVLLRDQDTCQLCGQYATQVDHIVPRRLMDEHSADQLDNLQSLCAKCNLRKGGRFFERAATPPTLPVSFYPRNDSIRHYQDESDSL